MVEVCWIVYGHGFRECWRWAMFFYLVLLVEQIEQQTHNTFGFGCAHVHKISIVWKTSHLLLQSKRGIKKYFENKNSSLWEHKPKFLNSPYILSFLWFSCWIVMCQMNFPLHVFSIHFLVCDDIVCIFHFLICTN